METRANYVAVGAFVLVLLLGLAGFVVWLGQVSLRESFDRYVVYFEGTVTGLQTGSAVRYRGIPVGQVEDIRIDPDNVERVRVELRVQADTPILEDSVASLELQGITGGVYVLISGGSRNAAMLAAVDDRDPPVIDSSPSALQAVLDSVPGVLENVNDLLVNANALLSDENQRALTESLINVRTLTEVLADSAATTSETIETLNALATNADGLISELRVDAARLSDNLDTMVTALDDRSERATVEVERTAVTVRRLAATYESVGGQIEALIAENRPYINDFAGSGLPEFTLMVVELRSLAETLTRVAERIERAPARFLFGDSDRGVPVE